MPTELPGCDELFERFFLRWYSGADRERRGYHATRPDAEGWGRPGSSVEEVCQLAGAGQDRVAKQISTMLDAAAKDWSAQLNIEGDINLGWIDAFDSHFTARRIANMIDRSDPSDFSNELLVTCCEFGAALGHVLLTIAPGTAWLYDWPYWESAVYDPPSGYRVNVFHWAIDKFSDYGVDDGFRPKLLACAELIRDGWKASA
jgi:hypothetical protein